MGSNCNNIFIIECYFISPKEDIIISSEDLEIQDFKTVLIQAPQTSGLQINVRIPFKIV